MATTLIVRKATRDEAELIYQLPVEVLIVKLPYLEAWFYLEELEENELWVEVNAQTDPECKEVSGNGQRANPHRERTSQV